MTKTLVLAEKPSVGKDIARVLQCHKNINGGLEGNKYIVTWALGHLVTLADPEMYDHKYQKWNLDDLPIMPERMKLVVKDKATIALSLITFLRKGSSDFDGPLDQSTGR